MKEPNAHDQRYKSLGRTLPLRPPSRAAMSDTNLPFSLQTPGAAAPQPASPPGGEPSPEEAAPRAPWVREPIIGVAHEEVLEGIDGGIGTILNLRGHRLAVWEIHEGGEAIVYVGIYLEAFERHKAYSLQPFLLSEDKFDFSRFEDYDDKRSYVEAYQWLERKYKRAFRILKQQGREEDSLDVFNQNIGHENVLRIERFVLGKPHHAERCAFILEVADYNLFEFNSLDEGRRLLDVTRGDEYLRMALHGFRGLQAVHDLPAFCADISALNIFVFRPERARENYIYKLGDFFGNRAHREARLEFRGWAGRNNPLIMAPEEFGRLLERTEDIQKADVYRLCAVLWHLIFRQYPIDPKYDSPEVAQRVNDQLDPVLQEMVFWAGEKRRFPQKAEACAHQLHRLRREARDVARDVVYAKEWYYDQFVADGKRLERMLRKRGVQDQHRHVLMQLFQRGLADYEERADASTCVDLLETLLIAEGTERPRRRWPKVVAFLLLVALLGVWAIHPQGGNYDLAQLGEIEWPAWEWPFAEETPLDHMQAAYNAAQASENGGSNAAVKLAAWTQFRQQYGADLPDTEIDNTMRRHADRRIRHWQQQQARATPTPRWRNLLDAMEAAYARAEQYDAGRSTPKRKIERWQQFLAQYENNLRQTRRDNEMRDEAQQRIRFWQQQQALAEKAPETLRRAQTPPQATPPPPQETVRRVQARMPGTVQVNSIGMELVVIQAGVFTMGTEFGLGREQPPHPVQLTQPFLMARHEVTQAQFRQFVQATGYITDAERKGRGCVTWTGSSWRRDREANWKNTLAGEQRPVVCVTWHDVEMFVSWLSEREGTRYRLPTEAEWEYAARAGTAYRYAGTDDRDRLCRYANVSDISAVRSHRRWEGVACDDGYIETAPVGQFEPNAWGLYDMNGNVREWIHDWYDEDYYRQSPQADPQGPRFGRQRLSRGGAWDAQPRHLRLTRRHLTDPDEASSSLGFRLVRAF